MSTPWAIKELAACKGYTRGTSGMHAISAMSLREFLLRGILYSARGPARVISVWLKVGRSSRRRLAGARVWVEPVPVRGQDQAAVVLGLVTAQGSGRHRDRQPAAHVHVLA
jgi:hypothetical protein